MLRAIAFLVVRRFEAMLALAMVIAIGSSVLGTLISFQINAATGPAIVLIQATLFVLALLFAPRGGLLRRRAA